MYSEENVNACRKYYNRELMKKIHTNTQPIVDYSYNNIIYNVWNDLLLSINNTTIDRELYNEYFNIEEEYNNEECLL